MAQSGVVRADVVELERIAALGWLAIESEQLGGWLLRASEGFTGRANAVLPLDTPGRPLDEALRYVQDWYAARGLPARFQVPMPAAAELDAALAERGWAAYNPTEVLTAPVATVLASAPEAVAVTITDEPSAAWLSAYHYRGQELPPVARRLLLSARAQAFASVADGDRVVAIGRIAVDAGWAGITAMEVAADCRRQGMGGRVLGALCGWAARHGAESVYLQVAEENDAGRALYARHGFRPHHTYHYRRCP